MTTMPLFRDYRVVVVVIGLCIIWLIWGANGFGSVESIICALITCWLLALSWHKPRHLTPEGKAVFITGCDTGFGFEAAKMLCTNGYKVFAGCLFPDKDGGKKLTGFGCDVIRCDVTKDDEVRSAKSYIDKNLGTKVLWAIVNNAGVGNFSPVEWCSMDGFESMMSVNALGPVRVTKAFLPLIRECRGRVVNVASLAGRFSLPMFGGYAMSKFACVAFSDCLRREMATFGVMVSTIEPTFYRTPMTQGDVLIKAVHQNWSSSSDEIQQSYGEYFYKSICEKYIPGVVRKSIPNPLEVVDEIVDAVCSENPKSRYVPNLRVRVKVFILSLLPVKLLDKMLQVRGSSEKTIPNF